MLVWPAWPEVERASRAWADRQLALRPDVVALGCFGSYARGDHGPGSDLDLVAVVTASDRPFVERGRDWDLRELPVPADLLIYTIAEWQRLHAGGGAFARVLGAETRWLAVRLTAPAPSTPPGRG